MRSMVDPLSTEVGVPVRDHGDHPNPRVADSWPRIEVLLAAVVTLMVAARIVVLPQLLLTAGDVLVLGLAPLWLPATRRFVGARLVIGLGLLALVSGALLTFLAAADHHTSTGETFRNSTLLFGLLVSLGFLLWAREKLGDALLAAMFGFGLLLRVVSRTSPLYYENPWKYGFSVPVTILLLSLCVATRRSWLALATTAALALVTAFADSRSSFALLLLTAALLAWQMRPLQTTRRSSALRGVLGLGIVAAVVYTIGQTLIVSGYLGALTQQRSLQQANETGSLILGGRPELAATLALMRDHPLGFGMGTLPNHHDIAVGKTGMASINYDPNNGYVENYMFGNGFSLHSVIGDLWARSGVVGLALVAVLLVLILRAVSRRVSDNAASAVLLYLSVKTMWNLFFGPFYSSIPVLELALALILLPRPAPSPAGEREVRVV